MWIMQSGVGTLKQRVPAEQRQTRASVRLQCGVPCVLLRNVGLSFPAAPPECSGSRGSWDGRSNILVHTWSHSSVFSFYVSGNPDLTSVLVSLGRFVATVGSHQRKVFNYLLVTSIESGNCSSLHTMQNDFKKVCVCVCALIWKRTSIRQAHTHTQTIDSSVIWSS